MTYQADAKPERVVPSAGLRYVKGYRDRLGKARYYLRRPGLPSRPLSGRPGTLAFQLSYEAAIGAPVRGAMPKPAGTIYVVQVRGHDLVKIGYATDPDTRLSQIEHGAGMPGGLATLHRMAGYPATERALHRRFAEQRLFGEWFRLSGAVEQWLEAAKGPREPI